MTFFTSLAATVADPETRRALLLMAEGLEREAAGSRDSGEPQGVDAPSGCEDWNCPAPSETKA